MSERSKLHRLRALLFSTGAPDGPVSVDPRLARALIESADTLRWLCEKKPSTKMLALAKEKLNKLDAIV